MILLALELIVQDFRLSQVATELNRRQYRTRAGTQWNAASVFELLPRLIDVGPRIFWRKQGSSGGSTFPGDPAVDDRTTSHEIMRLWLIQRRPTGPSPPTWLCPTPTRNSTF